MVAFILTNENGKIKILQPRVESLMT